MTAAVMRDLPACPEIDETAWYCELGAKLKAARERKGLRVVEVAEMTRLACSTITNFETGRKPIGLNLLQRLANVLGVSATSLLPSPAAPGAPIRQWAHREHRTMAQVIADEQAAVRAVIRQRRRTLGLHQKEVAIALGITRLTYSRLEAGPRTIRPEELLALCRLFGCSLRQLLSDAPAAEIVIAHAERAARAIAGAA